MKRSLLLAGFFVCQLFLTGQGFERTVRSQEVDPGIRDLSRVIFLPDETSYFRDQQGVGRMDRYGEVLWYNNDDHDFHSIDTFANQLWTVTHLADNRDSLRESSVFLRKYSSEGNLVAADTLRITYEGVYSTGPIPYFTIDTEGGLAWLEILARERGDSVFSSLHLAHFNPEGTLRFERTVEVGKWLTRDDNARKLNLLADDSYLASFRSREPGEEDLNNAEHALVRLQADGTFSFVLPGHEYRSGTTTHVSEAGVLTVVDASRTSSNLFLHEYDLLADSLIAVRPLPRRSNESHTRLERLPQGGYLVALKVNVAGPVINRHHIVLQRLSPALEELFRKPFFVPEVFVGVADMAPRTNGDISFVGK
ncbi:MAG: hypothetical protein AAFZ52_19785, partial [Bacteroidota bacterium]